jgi:hypothetical protein
VRPGQHGGGRHVRDPRRAFGPDHPDP